MTYIHPNVSSTIIDNSVSYLTSEGTTKLFAVFVAEKGPDNKIQTMTSVSEYIFNYGEPDLKYYGQAPYNILEWLKNGGEAYTLRVLPDDAQFANAFVNIQTKVSQGTKNVRNVNGEIVKLDDVTLRPTILYSSMNNNTTNALINNELKASHANTLDGYENHLLFTVVSRGRSDSYNKLGFRITLNDNYDNTYDFRLYNFEVMQINDLGELQTIEGPYVVSLDPDARNVAGESMFIEYVVNNYSEHLDIIFNEDEYEELGAIINPYVNPNKIDFFTGETRVVNRDTETYYDERTQKEEDIHISLTPYIDGEPLATKNIIDPTNVVEANILVTDNDYRKTLYLNAKEQESTIRADYTLLRKGSYSAYANKLRDYILQEAPVPNPTNKVVSADTSLVIAKNELDADRNAFYSAITDEGVANPEVIATVTATKYTDGTKEYYIYEYEDKLYKYDIAAGTSGEITQDFVDSLEVVTQVKTNALGETVYLINEAGNDYEYETDDNGNFIAETNDGGIVETQAYWMVDSTGAVIGETEHIITVIDKPLNVAADSNVSNVILYTYTDTNGNTVITSEATHTVESTTTQEVDDPENPGQTIEQPVTTTETVDNTLYKIPNRIKKEATENVTDSVEITSYTYNDTANLEVLKAQGDLVLQKTSRYLDLAKEAYGDLYLASTGLADLSRYNNIGANIDILSQYTLGNDKITLTINSARKTFALLEEEFVKAKADNSEAAYKDFFMNLYNEGYELYTQLEALDVDSFKIYNGEAFSDNLDILKNQINVLIDTYISRDDNTIREAIETGCNSADVLIAEVLKVTLQIQLENLENTLNKSEYYVSALLDDIKSSIEELVVDSTDSTILNVAKIKDLADTSEDIKHLQEKIDLYDSIVAAAGNNYYTLFLQNFNNGISLKFGSCGSIAIGAEGRDDVIEQLLIKGYEGLIDDSLIDKDKWQIDLILDANYPLSVKRAIIDLTTNLRGDFIALLDTGLAATPAETLVYRNSSLNYSNFRISIFSQNFVVSDSQYSGKSLQVTTPYFLASKIAHNDSAYGIHQNFVGPRRGILEGFNSINFNPNSEWKERFYKAQINYVEQTYQTTKLATQLTSQFATSALSYICNVRCLLKIQREVEKLMEVYIQERNVNKTYNDAQAALAAYLSTWTSNGACSYIHGSVYASAYDVAQNIMRVKIEMKFVGTIERIAIDLVVS